MRLNDFEISRYQWKFDTSKCLLSQAENRDEHGLISATIRFLEAFYTFTLKSSFSFFLRRFLLVIFLLLYNITNACYEIHFYCSSKKKFHFFSPSAGNRMNEAPDDKILMLFWSFFKTLKFYSHKY